LVWRKPLRIVAKMIFISSPKDQFLSTTDRAQRVPSIFIGSVLPQELLARAQP
jgi:hypothetical protein